MAHTQRFRRVEPSFYRGDKGKKIDTEGKSLHVNLTEVLRAGDQALAFPVTRFQ